VCTQNNWPSPLFSKKESSDANFEDLSRILLENTATCLPAFASHNVRSLAHACCLAEELGVSKTSFELQMLFGMAEPIARAFSAQGYLTRLYVPLGEMLPGMGYLVRRLLENTSNESFLRHTFFDENQIDDLLAKPICKE
jgi:RHH-type proline utilization regulon transcriptional repressor/proline dehydrogenase/delta 1-pyrroline-5-carboxylate dehydrogenase